MFGKTAESFQNIVEKLGDGKLFDSKESKDLEDKFGDERHSLLWEVWEARFISNFPTLSKVKDFSNLLWITKTDAEVLPWQNEVEKGTALFLLVPDFLLKNITNPIVKSNAFNTLLNNFPPAWVEKIPVVSSILPMFTKSKTRIVDTMSTWKEVDPDDFIDYIRYANQIATIVTLLGKKVLWDKNVDLV